jgi:hypothetical protein
MMVVVSLLSALGFASPVRAEADYLASLIAEAHAQRLAESRDWQVLLHYRATKLGGFRSEADGLGFFLAGKPGQTDRSAELDATLAAFFAAAPADPLNPDTQHAQCRFPARYAWLKRALAIDAARLPDQRCPLLDTWRTGIAAEAATLVYATAYLNSPASMYGHTFFRISRATGEGNPLLDYAVNFAADVNTTNGLVYAVRGVAGGFPGRFYVIPYYVKVQEYSNMESRDLWEYELALTREQVERLVLHAWETRTTHFDYYFVTKNCSYQLLTLLEVADPSLHLIERFSGQVIPSDTVRVILEQPGLVRRIAPRPSLVSTMIRRKADLARPEVRAAEQWVATAPGGTPPDLTGMPAPRQAQVIDAAYDYLRYRQGLKNQPTDDFKKRERQMFLARGRLGVPPQVVEAQPGIDAPERGHATLRLGVGGGVADQAGGGFETLSIRGAIHDYLDPSRGYPEDAELEMLHLRLRFDNDRRAAGVDRLDLLHILSAAPVDRWVHNMSWKVWAGADNARELGCERPGSPHAGWRCLYGGATTGGGFAARFGPQQRALAFLLAETAAAAGPAFDAADHRFRVGAGGEAGLVAEAGELLRLQLGVQYIYYVLGERRSHVHAHAAQSISIGRGLALRLGVDTAGTYAQVATELLGYF